MTTKIQRQFVLGDEWIYFKIYSGPKTLEKILIAEIADVTDELHQGGIVDQFFFIRYADPDYHLRVRFHMTDISNIYLVIEKMNKSLKSYLENRLVWKICTDTYSREIERYGKRTILLAENLFSLDSKAITDFLKEAEVNNSNQVRWLWGIKCIDLLLAKFGLSLKDKIEFYNMLNNGYSQEFHMNKPMQIQLDKKYRSEMQRLKKTIEQIEIADFPGISYIYSYMKHAEPIIQQILELLVQEQLEIPLHNFLGSLVHMHFNRLFRTKQRMHELVIYYFMHKFYTSQAARLKYSKNGIIA